jgi:hypothetical protein
VLLLNVVTGVAAPMAVAALSLAPGAGITSWYCGTTAHGDEEGEWWGGSELGSCQGRQRVANERRDRGHTHNGCHGYVHCPRLPDPRSAA